MSRPTSTDELKGRLRPRPQSASVNDEDGTILKYKMNHWINFWKAALCSLSFLGMYIALYSAQNIQSVLFEKDKFDSLGFYSNAIAYAG
jgi:hypothetical protein